MLLLVYYFAELQMNDWGKDLEGDQSWVWENCKL